ncbi:MAG: hypothetical protein A3H06_01150 [Candidatus Colwellbacteria bacterium RIFCSPLOWO2_12_FULL_44_13]|uniref:Rod shape-determining protein MreD n=3 Tax=Candidatus Colwelliibacteriota TaxID=1817904 RepID=A0A1G1Z7X1_9BACT|nr:MAG: hypothetical protein A3F24_01670 [Candidatus Colwellbacteria bacterium RIFCSPHIGHO2_12_FULL_44_17]OGY60529.1 MAG: hypothetical protein A3I31_02350 [Candidatus Colwellbacteria bacterium RIFCSPLOWO2_02_FULL_44_20b]OGY61636.1 MAG: hypothetical protein A3H06_01150 [Candidatus Colwellbacteria bacterium RIFCSPLOWO2_12_FULL_44_13]
MEVRKSAGILTTLALIAVATRFLPHPPNATAIGAFALFAGAYTRNSWSIFLVLIPMVISDMIIGFYSIKILAVVYGSFLLIAIIGRFLKENKSFENITLAAISGSVLFYLTTNYAVWMFGTLYPKTTDGLAASYFMALPFLGNMLLGDLVWSLAFIKGYELLQKKIPILEHFKKKPAISWFALGGKRSEIVEILQSINLFSKQ